MRKKKAELNSEGAAEIEAEDAEKDAMHQASRAETDAQHSPYAVEYEAEDEFFLSIVINLVILVIQ